jgi:O-antigen/teichoic acid export membrane protein
MQKNSSPTQPRFVTSTLSLGAFGIFGMILGLTTTVIITRHFSTVDFGFYSLALVLVSFLGQISTFGLEMSVSRFVAGSNEQLTKERYFQTAVVTRIVTILLVGILAWVGGPFLTKLFGQSLLPQILVYVPLLFALESFRSYLKSVLQGCLLFPRIGMSDVIFSFINLVLVLILVLGGGPKSNVISLILARALSSLMALIFAFISIPLKKRFSFELDILKALMKFGYPLQINDVLAFIYSRIDTFVIGAFLGPADVGIYEVARKIPDYLRNFYEPFRSVYYPFMSKHYVLDGRQQASKLLNDSVRFVAFITLFGTVIAILFGQEIIRLVFSDKYLSSAPIFALLMFNLSISLTQNVMGTTIVAAGDTQKPMIVNIFNAVGSWLGSVVLVPLYAILGAGIGTTIGTTMAYPLNVFFLKRRIDLAHASYLKPTGLFFVWGLIVLLLNPTSIWLKTLMLMLFLSASFVFHIVSKEDIGRLLEGSGLVLKGPLSKVLLWMTRP